MQRSGKNICSGMMFLLLFLSLTVSPSTWRKQFENRVPQGRVIACEIRTINFKVFFNCYLAFWQVQHLLNYALVILASLSTEAQTRSSEFTLLAGPEPISNVRRSDSCIDYHFSSSAFRFVLKQVRGAAVLACCEAFAVAIFCFCSLWGRASEGKARPANGNFPPWQCCGFW